MIFRRTVFALLVVALVSAMMLGGNITNNVAAGSTPANAATTPTPDLASRLSAKFVFGRDGVVSQEYEGSYQQLKQAVKYLSSGQTWTNYVVVGGTQPSIIDTPIETGWPGALKSISLMPNPTAKGVFFSIEWSQQGCGVSPTVEVSWGEGYTQVEVHSSDLAYAYEFHGFEGVIYPDEPLTTTDRQGEIVSPAQIEPDSPDQFCLKMSWSSLKYWGVEDEVRMVVGAGALVAGSQARVDVTVTLAIAADQAMIASTVGDRQFADWLQISPGVYGGFYTTSPHVTCSYGGRWDLGKVLKCQWFDLKPGDTITLSVWLETQPGPHGGPVVVTSIIASSKEFWELWGDLTDLPLAQILNMAVQGGARLESQSLIALNQSTYLPQFRVGDRR